MPHQWFSITSPCNFQHSGVYRTICKTYKNYRVTIGFFYLYTIVPHHYRIVLDPIVIKLIIWGQMTSFNHLLKNEAKPASFLSSASK